MRDFYLENLKSYITSSAKDAAPKICSQMGVKDEEDLMLQIDKVCDMFEDELRIAMISDWRKNGWKI